MDELLVEFLNESREGLAEIDLALLELERDPGDRAILSRIFRTMHTIKGTCGFLGLSRLERLAHAAENILDALRNETLPVTPRIVSLVLLAVDRCKEIVAALFETGGEPAGDDVSMIAELDAAKEGDDAAASAAPAPAMPAPAGTVESTPAPAPPVPSAPASAVAAEAPAMPAADPAPPAQTIRVGVNLLENLMTMVSELVLTRNQVLQLARAEKDSALNASLRRLSNLTTGLQEGVMKTRMQPVADAWSKLPRLVRDLGREMGKQVELATRGSETELDRQVLQLIKDPLTHMVRNSMDHGLETPAERRAAGKPETGRILLDASHQGGHIVIEVSDDGRGLDPVRIAAKALANGLATQAELDAMTPDRIRRFIFTPGFSTAAAVTSVSGRGVGMDVVKTNIEQIGGAIQLASAPGQGSTFTIRIPLTLAIVSALIVTAAGERFAIPQINVMELVQTGTSPAGNGPGGPSGAGQRPAGVSGAVIETLNGVPILRLRERLLPLVDLAGLLKLPEEGREEGRYVVVTSNGNGRFGIVVDQVLDTEEIVVKPMASCLRHIGAYGGNTILGDGSVAMILDPNGIARASGVRDLADPATVKDDGHPGPREMMSMLLFRAGGAEQKAVPLGLVSRIENIPAARIEMSGGRPVTQYRGKLMRLVAYPGIDRSGPVQPVLVFTDRDRMMGLMVDRILDVVDQELEVDAESVRDFPGLLGTTIIDGRATDIIDTHHWLTQANSDWFRIEGQARQRSVLLVEDSRFFRHMLAPTLSAAGFQVTVAENGRKALDLRRGGLLVDAIVSDIEMPEMDGFEFVRALRAGAAEGAPWSGLPVIALTGHNLAVVSEQGRCAGFDECIHKFELESLLRTLQNRLPAFAPA